ncbi:YbaK/aminoacyl-tRNA synthetase-associated domain-containing protein [Spinellus fusiger]|nr:YbaK/aminoacyl-tRNA synthetase-associated domain-containing protein [Spinellus fusiger]
MPLNLDLKGHASFNACPLKTEPRCAPNFIPRRSRVTFLSKMLVSELPTEQKNTLNALSTEIGQLYKSVSKEYLKQWEVECQEATVSDCPDSVKQAQKGIQKVGLFHLSKFIQVESNYYDWELQQRAFRVNAPSREHMCKSVLLENTRCIHDSIQDPNNARYYCVITQYVKPVNTQKLLNYVRDLTNKEISKKYYNFRLADAQKSFELTGYLSGGVCPMGMIESVPVIISKSVMELEPPVMYLGAGHIDWKWGIPVQAFVDATRCRVADLD